jgi:hypothetical protein
MPRRFRTSAATVRRSAASSSSVSIPSGFSSSPSSLIFSGLSSMASWGLGVWPEDRLLCSLHHGGLRSIDRQGPLTGPGDTAFCTVCRANQGLTGTVQNQMCHQGLPQGVAAHARVCARYRATHPLSRWPLVPQVRGDWGTLLGVCAARGDSACTHAATPHAQACRGLRNLVKEDLRVLWTHAATPHAQATGGLAGFLREVLREHMRVHAESSASL